MSSALSPIGTPDERADVVVCGAGIAGLALAHLLGSRGSRVLVLEREPRFREAFKGEVLQPRALHVLDAIGVLGAVRRSGAMRADGFAACAADGRVLGDLAYGDLPGPFDHMLVHGFRDLQAALAEDLPPSVELRFGASVQEVLADDAGRIAGVRAAGPHGPARIAATLTVASDGRGSRLRRAVGLDVLSARYRHEFIGFELNGAKNLPPRLCAYLVRRGVVLYFPLPDDRARMYVQSEPGVYRRQHAGDPRAWLEDVLDEVPALQSWAQQVHAAAGTGRILPIWRHRATRWSLPGFALAGDSAHCVHPIAAQGMSAALDDAWVLAELLSEAEDGTETGRLRAAQVDRAIDRYSTVRKDRAEFTARLSHSLAALLTGTSPAARALRRHELRVIDSNNRLRRILVHNMSGTGVRRFTAADRLAQLGLPDPRRGRPPRLAAEPLLGTADRADLDLDFLGADR